jgi:hypothetical protein
VYASTYGDVESEDARLGKYDLLTAKLVIVLFCDFNFIVAAGSF